jgi:prophage DNA circulation protein
VSTFDTGTLVGSIGGVATAAQNAASGLSSLLGGAEDSWAKSLQQASYGAIKFGVISSGTTLGRRTVVHEYPERDDVWVEDMGRRGRRFAITGFLLEDDLIYKGGPVIAQRKALEVVLEKRLDQVQPGLTLVHPTYGKVDNVCCINCEITEHVDHGRYFELRFDFIVSGARRYPLSGTSTSGQIAAAAASVKDASILDYAKKVISAVSTGAAAVKQAISTAVGWYQTATKLIHDVRNFVSSISTLAGNFGTFFGGANKGYSTANANASSSATVASLLASNTAARTAVAAAGAALSAAAATPADGTTLGAAATTLVQAVVATAADPADSVRLLSSLAQYQPDEATTTSTVGVAMAAVQTASGALYRRTALAELAVASSTYQPASSNDAITLRNTISSLLADEITVAGDAGDDNTYLALLDLRAAVINDLNTRGAQLAAMTTYSFKTTMSSLVVAQQMYRDPSREADLIRQAQPIHPAFMPTSFTALSE